jgi:hypothetical protein
MDLDDTDATDATDPADQVDEEIRGRLRARRMRGDFAAIHPAPAGPGDVPDQAGARLVLLGPGHPHRAGATESPALERAAACVARAGDGVERVYRNMLVFLAPDADRLDGLRAAIRGEADQEVGGLVDETWRWLLAPSGPDGWTIVEAGGRDDLAMRSSRALRDAGSLFVDYPAERLRADLDTVPLWPPGVDHVSLAEVWEAYARTLGLPRLRSSAVLAAAVLTGISRADWATRTFAYAESWDPGERRFAGLVAGLTGGGVAFKGSGLIVRPDAARAQLEGGSVPG